MIVTPHQEDRIQQVETLLEAGNKRIVLKGSAGVGKTYVAKILLERFLTKLKNKPNTNRWQRNIAYITAPTNKALAILQDKIPASDLVEFKTIHSALKLNRNIDTKTGRVSFKPSFSDRNRPFQDCVICFLDECSMLNTELLDMLDDYSFPIIFLGDDKQLNPVGEDVSPVFHRGYPEVELMEIIRQGAGNPIIELSRNLNLIKQKTPSVTEEGFGYLYENERQKIINSLAQVNGTDEMKYLAWTNLEVDAMNKRVRQLLYGSNPQKVELGETLVFNAPKGDIWTNKEVPVQSLKIVTEEILVPTSYSKFTNDGITAADKLKMKIYRVNDEFNIVHEHSEGIFNTILATIKTNCAKFGWNWKCKFFFEEQFADTKYNHAISVHKSQGSTYQEAILNVGNINYNKNLPEKERLLYTGVTRAAKLLILNNV